MRKVTIRLSDEQAAWLELTARRAGKSKSSIVRQAIEEDFALHRKGMQPVERTMGSEPALGTESDDCDARIDQAIGDALAEK